LVSFGLRSNLVPSAMARGAALVGSLQNQIALEGGYAAEHGQHQPTVRRGRIGPKIAERLEGSA
jgi:hypothetical protein